MSDYVCFLCQNDFRLILYNCLYSAFLHMLNQLMRIISAFQKKYFRPIFFLIFFRENTPSPPGYIYTPHARRGGETNRLSPLPMLSRTTKDFEGYNEKGAGHARYTVGIAIDFAVGLVFFFFFLTPPQNRAKPYPTTAKPTTAICHCS